MRLGGRARWGAFLRLGAPGILLAALGGSFTTLSCSDPEHPAPIDRAKPNDGGEGGTGTGPNPGMTGEGGGESGVTPVAPSIFDPDQVYIVSKIKGTQKWAIAPVEDPTDIYVGIDAKSFTRLAGTHLYIQQVTSTTVWDFRIDLRPSTLENITLPAKLSMNDGLARTAPCESKAAGAGPYDFLTAAGGRFFHRCPTTARIWHEGEDGNTWAEIPEGVELEAISPSDLMIVRQPGLDLGYGVMYPGETDAREVPLAQGYRARGTDTGFTVLSGLTLFDIDDQGVATELGTFPVEAPTDLGFLNVASPTFSASYDLYQLAIGGEVTHVLKTPLGGATEVIYTAEPGGILDGVTVGDSTAAYLITGP